MSDAAPCGAVPVETASCELADIFRQYGQAYQETHHLTPAQRKASARKAALARWVKKLKMP